MVGRRAGDIAEDDRHTIGGPDALPQRRRVQGRGQRRPQRRLRIRQRGDELRLQHGHVERVRQVEPQAAHPVCQSDPHCALPARPSSCRAIWSTACSRILTDRKRASDPCRSAPDPLNPCAIQYRAICAVLPHNHNRCWHPVTP